LARICKSIKKLEFDWPRSTDSNSGIIKLIEVQKNLNEVEFICRDEQLRESLEESLIKHADTIQHLIIDWKPFTRILLYLVNLISLEIYLNSNSNELNYLENLSLPILKILKTQGVPFKNLANLIENTKGHLSEISIYDGINEKLIYAIYQNCPNLRYLKISLKNNVNSLIYAV